jgi:hypothetical protein
MEEIGPSGKVGQICPQILVLAPSDANPSQCLSAGTLLPDLIAEAVDLATPLDAQPPDVTGTAGPQRAQCRATPGQSPHNELSNQPFATMESSSAAISPAQERNPVALVGVGRLGHPNNRSLSKAEIVPIDFAVKDHVATSSQSLGQLIALPSISRVLRFRPITDGSAREEPHRQCLETGFLRFVRDIACRSVEQLGRRQPRSTTRIYRPASPSAPCAAPR